MAGTCKRFLCRLRWFVTSVCPALWQHRPSWLSTVRAMFLIIGLRTTFTMFTKNGMSKEFCMAHLITKHMKTYIGNGKLVAPQLGPIWDGMEQMMGEFSDACFGYGNCARSEVFNFLHCSSLIITTNLLQFHEAISLYIYTFTFSFVQFRLSPIMNGRRGARAWQSFLF